MRGNRWRLEHQWRHCHGNIPLHPTRQHSLSNLRLFTHHPPGSVASFSSTFSPTPPFWYVSSWAAPHAPCCPWNIQPATHCMHHHNPNCRHCSTAPIIALRDTKTASLWWAITCCICYPVRCSLPLPLLLIAATQREKERETADPFQRTLRFHATSINKRRAPSTWLPRDTETTSMPILMPSSDWCCKF